MKALLYISIVAITVGLCVCQASSQIQSTGIGGPWNNATTWVGGAIPGAGDDVIIQGPVVHESASGYTILAEYCNNLTIAPGGSLHNGDYGGGSGTYPLYVGGNVVNNGVVANGTNDFLKIFISGNLENNDTWMPYETELQVSSNHNLGLASGKSFGSRFIVSGEATLTALTDMFFTCDWNTGGGLYRDYLHLNGNTFVLGAHSITLHRDCLINSGTLSGDFTILGKFTVGYAVGYDIRDTLVFVGNVTVADTLAGNIYGGGYGIYKLRVVGNLTNNGVIRDDYDVAAGQEPGSGTMSALNPDDLELLITGDILNNGIWSANFTKLIGPAAHSITQGTGSSFDGYLTDLDPSGGIQAQSDITVARDVDLNGATINMHGYELKVGGVLYDGYINHTTLRGGLLQSITSVDDLTIRGLVTIDNNNVFLGSVVVEDTLQSNEYGGGSTTFTLQIPGDVVNNGLIRNINTGDRLALEIGGSIANNGRWENSSTIFSGNAAQYITQTAGTVFETDFNDADPLSAIMAGSDISVRGNVGLNSSTWMMRDHELAVDGELTGGTVTFAKIRNALLRNMRTEGPTEIRGIVKLGDGNECYGDLLVSDTLQSIPYGGGAHTYVLRCYGSLFNNGLIRDEPTESENLAVYAGGDIINYGRFTNYRVYQLYYADKNIRNISIHNSSLIDWQVNGAAIAGGSAFAITAGGGTGNVVPGSSYDITLQFTPDPSDTNATLTIASPDIGTLSTIYLVGSNGSAPVGVREEDDRPAIPSEFALCQNYPNPFNPSTVIRYSLPVPGNIRLKIYDLLGREVATLVDGVRPAGEHQVQWDASGMPGGMYLYRLESGTFRETRKLMLVK
jgi:hypothetical protein